MSKVALVRRSAQLENLEVVPNIPNLVQTDVT